jgi:chemotaxis protein MotD
VTEVAQETHFAPPDPLGPARQVAAAVLSAVAVDRPQAAETPPRAAPPAAPVVHAAAGSAEPLRVLRLELDPGNLGAVSITMRLSGTRLELEVAVDRRNTLALITKDRDVLSSSLETSGYALDNLTIKAADVAPPDPGASRLNDARQDGTPQDSTRQDSTRPDRERQPAARGRDDQQHNRRQDNHEKNRPSAPRGDVFV